jgi:hypothetical protein
LEEEILQMEPAEKPLVETLMERSEDVKLVVQKYPLLQPLLDMPDSACATDTSCGPHPWSVDVPNISRYQSAFVSIA